MFSSKNYVVWLIRLLVRCWDSKKPKSSVKCQNFKLTRFPQFCDEKLEMAWVSVFIKKICDLVDPPSHTVLRQQKIDMERKMSEFQVDAISPILWRKVGDELSECFHQKIMWFGCNPFRNELLRHESVTLQIVIHYHSLAFVSIRYHSLSFVIIRYQ